jgi:uncharacterized protein (TIGR00725 family)
MHVLIAVIGSSEGSRDALDAAFETGREIMESGYTLICGGMGGVMEAACRGAHSVVGEGTGRIIGIIPGSDKNTANPFADIVIATGIGYARNSIIASAADAVIAVSGGSGTLSEISFAWQYGKPIVIIRGLPGITETLIGRALDDRRGDAILGADDPEHALALIREILPRAS